MKMLFQRAVTNGYLDFITQGDDAGYLEDRGQLWALPGKAERLQQRDTECFRARLRLQRVL